MRRHDVCEAVGRTEVVFAVVGLAVDVRIQRRPNALEMRVGVDFDERVAVGHCDRQDEVLLAREYDRLAVAGVGLRLIDEYERQIQDGVGRGGARRKEASNEREEQRRRDAGSQALHPTLQPCHVTDAERSSIDPFDPATVCQVCRLSASCQAPTSWRFARRGTNPLQSRRRDSKISLCRGERWGGASSPRGRRRLRHA